MRSFTRTSRKNSIAVRALIPVLCLSVSCGGSGSSLKGDGFEFVGQVSELDLHKAYVEIQKDELGQRAIKSWRSITWDKLQSSVTRSANANRDIAFNIGKSRMFSKSLSAVDYRSSMQGFSQFKNIGQLMDHYQVKAAAVTPEGIQRGAELVAASMQLSDADLDRLGKNKLDQLVRAQLLLLEVIGTAESMSNQKTLGFVWLLIPAIVGAISAARLAPHAARAATAAARAGVEAAGTRAAVTGAARIGTEGAKGAISQPTKAVTDVATKICEATCESPKNPEDQPNIVGGAL